MEGWQVIIGASCAGLAVALPAVAAAVVAIWRTWGRQSRTAERTAIAQWREIVEALQKQVERQDGLIEEMSVRMRALDADHAECLVERTEQYGTMALIHAYACRMAGCCRKFAERLGEPIDLEELPPMPPRPPKIDRERLEFERRSLEQKKQNVQQLSGVIPPTPPSGGAP